MIPFPAGAEIFPFSTASIQPSSEAYPFFYPVGIRDPTLVLQWQEHEADSSHSCSAKIKNALSHTSIYLYGMVFHEV
jgi:hypothetical protein